MSRTSRRAIRGLTLLAVLTAGLGVHVIHPWFHSLHGCSGHAHDSAAPPPAGRAGHDARLVSPAGHPALVQAPECPVCLFLASFHSCVTAFSVPPVPLDATPTDLVRVEPRAPASPAWYVASARAPPAVPS